MQWSTWVGNSRRWTLNGLFWWTRSTGLLTVRYPRGDKARPISGEWFGEWFEKWIYALGVILVVSLRWTLQDLACSICTPNRGEIGGASAGSRSGRVQSAIDGAAAAHYRAFLFLFFFFFYFLPLQLLTDVLHDERDDRDEIWISLHNIVLHTCVLLVFLGVIWYLNHSFNH